ncbi:MAG: hypothetical protein N2510_09430 [Ignavibacteria bacterium]|nr:hypothetical protein [Ignavibacteria bacterium]
MYKNEIEIEVYSPSGEKISDLNSLLNDELREEMNIINSKLYLQRKMRN